MKQNWVLIGGIVAVLAIPFGLAAFEDSTREKPPSEEGDLDGYDEALADDYNDDGDDDDDDDDEAGDEVIARWKRADEVDLGFLDELASATEPWLTDELAAALLDAESGLIDALDDPVEELNDAHGTDQVRISKYVMATGARIVVNLPAMSELLPALTRRWGQPRSTRAGDTPSFVWFSGSDRRVALREFAGDTQLEFGHILDAEDVVARFVLDSTLRTQDAFIAMVRESFERHILADQGDGLEVRLPPTRHADASETTIWIASEGPRASEVVVNLDFGFEPAMRDKLLAALAARLGEPSSKADPISGELINVYKGGLSVTVSSHALIMARKLR